MNKSLDKDGLSLGYKLGVLATAHTMLGAMVAMLRDIQGWPILFKT